MTSFDIYTVKESDSIQPLSAQSHFSAVYCFYRVFSQSLQKSPFCPYYLCFVKLITLMRANVVSMQIILCFVLTKRAKRDIINT